MRNVDVLISRLNLYKGRFCLFGGAGISVCAGVPLASRDCDKLPSIVTNIRRDFYASLGLTPLVEPQLSAWYSDQKLLQNPDTVYSDALNLIGDTPRARQHYLRRFFDGKQPGECHKKIAALVAGGFFDVIVTTNFDDLTERAIRARSQLAPKVAAHDALVDDILLSDEGPKVVKLHGDYLFSDIRNTEAETQRLTENMRVKLRSIIKERGLVVVGYSGSDNSVMAVLEQMAFDGGHFPFGLYWLHREGSPPRARVTDFVEKAGGRLLAVPGAESWLGECAGRLAP